VTGPQSTAWWFLNMKLKNKMVIGGFFLFALLCVWGWATNPMRHNVRYHSTGLNSHAYQPLPAVFSDYLRVVHAMIGIARHAANANDAPIVVAENTPIKLRPNGKKCKANPDGKYENGVLLIHGFTDSPYSFHTLGQYFLSKCFVVQSVLLPGHGTVPGDLLQVHYQDWINVVDYGVNTLSKQVNHVYLSGYSLGGLLAVNEALDHPEKISRLILFSPLFKMKFAYPALITPYYWLSQAIPRIQWVSQHEDLAEARYESYPVAPVYQMVKLMQKTEEKLTKSPISLPIFVLQSAEDQTIDAVKTWEFFGTNTNPLSRLRWFTATNSYPSKTDQRIAVINSDLSSRRILSLSHLAFALPESDPIYGIHGRYKDCLHYKEHSPQWLQCQSGQDTYLGETTPQNLKGRIIQRLSFNPFFDYMIQQLDAFIAS
jgi:esterase/lipase